MATANSNQPTAPPDPKIVRAEQVAEWVAGERRARAALGREA